MFFALTEPCGNPPGRCGNPWNPCGNPVESLGLATRTCWHMPPRFGQESCVWHPWKPAKTLPRDAETHGNLVKTKWKPLDWRTGPVGTCHLNQEKIMVFGTQGNLRNPFLTMRKPVETLWKPSANPWVGDMGLLASATHGPCGNPWKSCITNMEIFGLATVARWRRG